MPDFANQIRSHPAMVIRRATLEPHGQFSVRSSVLSTTGNTYARSYKYNDSDFPTWVQDGTSRGQVALQTIHGPTRVSLGAPTSDPFSPPGSFVPCLGSGSSTAGRLGNSNPKPQATLAVGLAVNFYEDL